VRRMWMIVPLVGALALTLTACGGGGGVVSLPTSLAGAYAGEYTRSPIGGSIVLAVMPNGSMDVTITDEEFGVFNGSTSLLTGGSFSVNASGSGATSIMVSGQFSTLPDGSVRATGSIRGAFVVNSWTAPKVGGSDSNAFDGDWSGTYGGGEAGTWVANIQTDGTVSGTAQSPSCGQVTLSGRLTLTGMGQIEGSGSGACRQFRVTWTGTFYTRSGQFVGSGSWTSTSGLSGTWQGTRIGDERFTWPIDPTNPSNGFYAACGDWPNIPDACYWLNSGWRDANPFQRFFNPGLGYHLGADWNLGSGSDDANLPVYAVANGTVSSVLSSVPGWGNIIFVRHNTSFGVYTSMYAHVNRNTSGPPTVGQRVRKGEQIARIGNAGGLYPYHLHFEIREGDNTTPGPGYTSSRCSGATCPQRQIDPNTFIASHR
jgi:murein DD-endopeptidase MepM/ murein hydrolase activator NlpD